MKKLFSFLPKKAWFAVLSLAVMFGLVAAVQAGFGPDRPTFTMAKPASYITFNSITDNPVAGDERTFLKGALPGATKYSDPVTDAKDGQQITVSMYVHNDAAANLNLKAQDTTVRLDIPKGSKTKQVITGYVSASNAKPKTVYDTLDISSVNNQYMELEYVPGSAKLTNNYFKNGVKLPDTIVTTGAQVGYNKLNGVVPGCSEFSGWVTVLVKVKSPHYVIQKSVRLPGEGADKWRQSTDVKINEKAEWLIKFQNVGSTGLNNVVVLDHIPSNMVIDGSVKLINTNHPAENPYVYPANAVQMQDGKPVIYVNAGGYLPGGGFYLRFDTKVVDTNSSLKCGLNKLTNQAWATPEGNNSVTDTAWVNVNKDCGQPVFKCDALNVKTIGGREIEATVKTTAQNGAKLSDVKYTFGDSNSLITDKTTVNHTYANDGTYTIKVVPSFMVDGKKVTAESDNCVATVKFENEKPVPTPTPTEVVPGELPNTGAGGLIGIFAGSSVLGTLGYRFLAVRRRQ